MKRLLGWLSAAALLCATDALAQPQVGMNVFDTVAQAWVKAQGDAQGRLVLSKQPWDLLWSYTNAINAGIGTQGILRGQTYKSLPLDITGAKKVAVFLYGIARNDSTRIAYFGIKLHGAYQAAADTLSIYANEAIQAGSAASASDTLGAYVRDQAGVAAAADTVARNGEMVWALTHQYVSALTGRGRVFVFDAPGPICVVEARYYQNRGFVDGVLPNANPQTWLRVDVQAW